MISTQAKTEPVYVQDKRRSYWILFVGTACIPTFLIILIVFDYLRNPHSQLFNVGGWSAIGLLSTFIALTLQLALKKRRIEFYEDHIRIYPRFSFGKKFRQIDYSQLVIGQLERGTKGASNAGEGRPYHWFKAAINVSPEEEESATTAITRTTDDVKESVGRSPRGVEKQQHRRFSFSFYFDNDPINGSQGPARPLLYDWLSGRPGVKFTTSDAIDQHYSPKFTIKQAKQIYLAITLCGLLLTAIGSAYIVAEGSHLRTAAAGLAGQLFITLFATGLVLLFFGLVGLMLAYSPFQTIAKE